MEPGQGPHTSLECTGPFSLKLLPIIFVNIPPDKKSVYTQTNLVHDSESLKNDALQGPGSVAVQNMLIFELIVLISILNILGNSKCVCWVTIQ